MSGPAPAIRSAVAVTAALLLTARCVAAAEPTTADCVHANNSAVTLRNDHKLRAARDKLLVCATHSCPADIRKECIRRIDEVNAALPTIIFEARDGSGKDIGAVKVTMDGELLAERLEGTALAVDPGEHTFVFEMEGRPPQRKDLLIHESEKDRREAVTIGALATTSPPQKTEPEAPSAIGSGGLGTQKVLAIVAGGVGVVGVGIGSVFGVMAMSKRNHAQSLCPNVCKSQGDADLWSAAGTTARISDVAFIAGGVALAGGVVLWLTAAPGSARDAAVRIGIGPGTLQLRGAW